MFLTNDLLNPTLAQGRVAFNSENLERDGDSI